MGDGWFAATEKSDYIQAIGLNSAKFQQEWAKRELVLLGSSPSESMIRRMMISEAWDRAMALRVRSPATGSEA